MHCRRGADRIGLAVAVYRIAVQGWSKEEAITEMTQGGFAFYTGWQNLIRYLRDLDIDALKRQAGLSIPVRVSGENLDTVRVSPVTFRALLCVHPSCRSGSATCVR